MKTIKSYTDFLENEDFIRWTLSGDEVLANYWNDFLIQYPECKKDFQLAIVHATKIRLNHVTLSGTEKQQLQDRIHTSVRLARSKRKMRRLIYYGAAACVSLFLGTTYWFYSTVQPEQLPETSQSAIIVGQALHSEDISLISGSKTTSFDQDVNLQVEKDGSATVMQANSKEKKVEISTNTLNKLVVPYGKRSKIILSDGTIIWLNSGSVLEFPAHFIGNTREVHLKGEMYAEVEKDHTKPFIVHTSDFNVRVYGTRFNVSAYETDDCPSSCVLVQGSVGIQSKQKPEIRMQHNDMVIYQNHQFVKKQVDVSHYTSWKDGYLEFDDTSIIEVLDKIGRYYNLSFDFGNQPLLLQRTCSGKIYLSENLDTVLATISLLSSAEYRKENQTIFITVNPK